MCVCTRCCSFCTSANCASCECGFNFDRVGAFIKWTELTNTPIMAQKILTNANTKDGPMVVSNVASSSGQSSMSSHLSLNNQFKLPMLNNKIPTPRQMT